MQKLYKLTNENGVTRAGYRNATQWGIGVTSNADETLPPVLCTEGVIHAYESPELAILMNPIHADLTNPRLWEAEGKIVAREGQLKVGCRSLTTTKELTLPECTTEIRVRFAILCALKIYEEPGFVKWADEWLRNIDRSKAAARAAARAAEAEAAAEAARAAARVAETEAAWEAVWEAARAATARAEAARAAARTAEMAAAEAKNENIDLIDIAKKAFECN
jgi:hypothetical protein